MRTVFPSKLNLGWGEREARQGSAARLPRTVRIDHVRVHVSYGLIGVPGIDGRKYHILCVCVCVSETEGHTGREQGVVCVHV